jgi:RNA polymerase sigma-70 factor, ECF subfamily
VEEAAAGVIARTEAGSDPDAAWIERAKGGDRTACRMLIRRHQKRTGAVLRRMLVPQGLDHLTEDLAQETFTRAFRALGDFDVGGAARFSTWLLRIATRLAINELRRARVEVVATPALETVPGTNRADAAHDRQRLAEAIVRAVGMLPPDHRAVFVLREYEGLDYAEIASIVGVELGTVKSRLSRARTTLRQALSEVHRE